MQIVININEDGKVTTSAQADADYLPISEDSLAAAGGASDGGSAPSSSEDVLADVVSRIPVEETDAPLNGGSA